MISWGKMGEIYQKRRHFDYKDTSQIVYDSKIIRVKKT